jgi:uncharacterized protein
MTTVPVVCIALMGIVLFALGANVSRHRTIRAGDGDQAPTDPADRLLIAQRAHGNAAEYVPTLAALIIVCASLTDGWWLSSLALAALVARVIHAYATLTAETMNAFIPLRTVGAYLTYLTGVLLGVTAVVSL